MRIMGRSKGRARRNRYELEKAFSAGAARGFASANMTAQPRAVALGDAINALTSGQQVEGGSFRMVDMLRDPRDEVPFGPINPLAPAPLDPSRPDTQRPEPRLTEYPVAWNLPGSADAPVPWATLRAAADAVDIIRRCISVRQEQLQGLDWSITLDEQVVQGMYAASDGSQGRTDIEAELRRKLLPEIERLTTFWRNPWKANGLSFEQWVNGIMEDHLVLDAVAIYPRTTYGGELSALELIDPTTIKLLIDYRGARPQHPFPAFQQILYGFPRAEFGSCYAPDGDDAVKPVEGFMADQLFYFREQYRTFTPYGYSAVQQALISARLYLRRQGWMLAEYDDGSTPLTFLVPDAKDGTLVEKLTYKTRRAWEDSINSELAGQTRARNRMKVLMPGMQPVQMQGIDERYKPEYDKHLITMLAGHFGVTSTGLGFNESQGLGNSGLHEGQERTQDAATTKPDKRMIERIVNELMVTFQGAPAELKFKFTDPDAEDSAAEDTTANQQRARGTITLNEDRKRLGLAPLPFREADMAMVGSAAVWVPLEGLADQAEAAREAEVALVDDQLATGEQTRELSAEQAAMDAEALEGETAEKALELAAYTRWARKRGGAARRPFICKALAPSDFPGEQVPSDVDFAEWVWVPDGLPDDASDDVIEKAFGQGNDNWRSLARDSRGRWVKRGSMRVDALGPSSPDKPVLAGLARDAERRRAASSQLRVSDASTMMGGMTSPKITQSQQAMLRRAKTDGGVTVKPGEEDSARGKNAAALERAGLLEQFTPLTTSRGTHYRPTGPGEHGPSEGQREAEATRRLNAADGINPDEQAGRFGRRNGDADVAAQAAQIDAAAAAERIARHDQAVRVAVQDLQSEPGALVSMVDVRAQLKRRGMTRADQDAALRRLVTTGDRALNTFPEDNQKILDDEMRAAAVDFGAGPQHVISLDPPRATESKRPATEAEATAHADKLKADYDAAQSRAHEADDAAYDADREDAALNAAAVTAQAEADRKRREYDAAEADLNDRFIAPRMRAEREASDRSRTEHMERLNAERAERERKAAEDAAVEVERKAREREENARRVAEIQAETRAELARRTPEAFALMLDGGDKATTHAPSRKILAEMREQGWTMTHMNGSMMRFEAPDGRGIRMTYGKSSVKWERGDYKGNQTMGESISLTTAAALVKDKPTPAARAEAVAASTPDAPKPSISDMMAANMASSTAAAPAFGAARGKVTGAEIQQGTRVSFRGTSWHVDETPRRARPDSEGRTGVVFRATREDQGIQSTMRVNDGSSLELAAPKGGGASHPKAEASAAPAEHLTRGAALAAAPKDVEASGARGVGAKGAAAIERYRGKAFSEINGELRRGDTMSAANASTAREIDRVMGESRLTAPVAVHRGVGNVAAVFGDASKRNLTGAEWTDATYQSTSTEPDVADRFRMNEDGQRHTARIVMRVPAGVGAVQLSDERYEAELLLQRGLRMRVVSDTGPWRRGQKNPRTIEVEVIPA